MVYPGEWAVAREDVEDDERLMGEIERTFGADVKDQVSFKMRKFVMVKLSSSPLLLKT